MKCLNCKAALDEQQVHGLTVDICPSCNSIWFDRGELELFKLQANKEQIPKLGASAKFERKSEVTGQCPKCKAKTLDMGKIRDYEAGRCSICQSIWLTLGPVKHKLSKRASSTSPLIDIVWMVVEVIGGFF